MNMFTTYSLSVLICLLSFRSSSTLFKNVVEREQQKSLESMAERKGSEELQVLAPSLLIETGIEQKLQHQSANWVVHDILGNEVINKEASSWIAISDSLQHLPKGVYFISVFMGDNTFREKLIKA